MKEVKGLILDENFKERNSVVGQQIEEIKILKVVGYTTETSNLRITKNTVYECECKCGQIFQGRARDIKQGKILSCGCRKKENARKLGLSNLIEDEEQVPLNCAYSTYQKGSLKRNLDFQITREEFSTITSQNCFYCNSEPKQSYYYATTRKVRVFNGLDRKDNNKGYTLDNVVPCCKTCNFGKHNLTYTEYLDWIQRLIKYQISLLTSQTSKKEKEEIK